MKLTTSVNESHWPAAIWEVQEDVAQLSLGEEVAKHGMTKYATFLIASMLNSLGQSKHYARF